MKRTIDDLSLCILCSGRYDPRIEKGKMSCRVHPKVYNNNCDGKKYIKDHYECCGATTNREDHNHCEYSRPFGCLPIDHVSSIKELNEHFVMPYFYIKDNEAQELEVISHSSDKKKGNVFHIKNQDDLDNDITMEFYEERSKTINPKLIYEKITDTVQLTVSQNRVYLAKRSTKDIYTYANKKGQQIRDKKFEPFYIIRRIAKYQDPYKLKEISSGKRMCFIRG